MQQQEVNYNIEMGEALIALKKCPHFNKLIMEGYLNKKALDSVSLLGVPQIKQKGARGDVIEDLVAISNLSYFLHMVEQFYQSATEPVLSEQEQAELNLGGEQ